MPMLNQQAAEESNTMQQQQCTVHETGLFQHKLFRDYFEMHIWKHSMSLIKPITKYLKYLSHASLV